MKVNNLLYILTMALVPYAVQSQHHYQRSIEGVSADGWYSLSIPPEMFDKLNPDFSDIRIVQITENDTVEVPYVVKIKTDEITEETVTLPVANKSKKGGKRFLTFELKDGETVNYLNLEFKQRNFFAYAKLEGSHNQREWFDIEDGMRILAIHNTQADYEISTIRFPQTNYRYIRLSVESDTTLTLHSASFKNHQVKEGEYKSIPATWNVQHNKKEKLTIVDIHFEHATPLSHLAFEVESRSDYYRQVVLSYVTDSVKTLKGWEKFYETFYHGYLTSFSPNTFELPVTTVRDVRMAISNQNNPPLALKSVTATGPVVAVLAQLRAGNNLLRYGDNAAVKPQYDLDYFKEKIPDTTATATLGPEQNIAPVIDAAQPLLQSKLWLWGAMIAVIGILGFFTLRMMRSSQSQV